MIETKLAAPPVFALQTAPSLEHRQLAAVAPNGPPAVVADLDVVRGLRREHASAFAQITKGKAGHYDGLLKRTDHYANKLELKDGGNGVLCGLLGAIVGTGAGFVGSSWLLGIGVFATGCLVTPTFLLIEKLTRRAEARAAKKLVAKASIQSQLDAFVAASGAEKAARGALLGDWLTTLNEKRAVEPPARVALEAVRGETGGLPAAERRRVDLLSRLGALIERSPVTRDVVRDLEYWRACWPDGHERCDLTTAALDALEAPGRDVDYDGAHALYDLRLANEREREAPSADRAL